MRLIVLAAVLASLGGVWNYVQTPLTIESTSAEIARQTEQVYFRGKPFTGIEIERYANGEIYKKMNYVDGRLEGESREFHFSMHPRATWNYHHGLKSGRQLGWYAEGPKRFEQNFTAGVLNGEQIEWHLNGHIFQRLFYVDGVQTERKILFPHGEIFSNYRIYDQRKYGLDNGELCMQPKREGER
jgi:antitoxin component YwqK of YwqJK toxin-antitoxin module